MFKQSKRNSDKSPTSKTGSIIPDPWEAIEAESHFPSPLELDRLLREAHPLISAAEELPEILPANQPGTELLPAPRSNFEVNPATVLLKNELKLHKYVLEKVATPIEKALALLYWLAIESEHLPA